MKNWQFNTLFLALILCLTGAVLQSAGNRETSQERAEMEALGANSVGGYFRANYRLDTITNNAADTFGIYSRNSTTTANVTANKYYLNAKYTPFLSLYTGDITIEKKNLSGTTSVTLYIEKSGTTIPSTTNWILVDSISAATAGVSQIKISEMTGEIYRARVKGRGTQSSTYLTTGLFKKKN